MCGCVWVGVGVCRCEFVGVCACVCVWVWVCVGMGEGVCVCVCVFGCVCFGGLLEVSMVGSSVGEGSMSDPVVKVRSTTSEDCTGRDPG